jgi:hypothetical protein
MLVFCDRISIREGDPDLKLEGLVVSATRDYKEKGLMTLWYGKAYWEC